MIKPETSDKMRYLMRLNAEKGTARQADVPGYYVGGKTGTSEKVVGGRYSKNKVLNYLHGRAAGRRSALPPPDHARRAAGLAGNPRISHLRLECGADRRSGHRPDRAACSASSRASTCRRPTS